MKKLISLTSFVLILLLLSLVWQKMSGGVRLDKIYPYETLCQKPRKDQSISFDFRNQLLGQTFHYLDKGCQVYVYTSKDQKRVLKLARLSRYRLPFWQIMIKKIPIAKNYVLDRKNYHQKMMDMALTSYKLAYDRLKEETAIEWISLEMHSESKLFVTLEDALYRKQKVDLNQTLYLLQKKAIPIEKILLKIKKTHNFDELEVFFESYFDTILRMVDKRITNKDYNCVKNLGVLEGRVIFTDVGSFVFDSHLDPKRTVERFTRYFYKWAQKHFKEAIPYFNQAKSLAIKKIEKTS